MKDVSEPVNMQSNRLQKSGNQAAVTFGVSAGCLAALGQEDVCCMMQ